MRWFWLMLIVGCVFLIVFGGVFNFLVRRAVFRESSLQSNYTGMGKNLKNVDSHLIVYPKNGDEYFVASLADWDRYDRAQYNITAVAKQTITNYTVGIVEGWEEISNSKDKYLLIEEQKGGLPVKYRIGFELSTLYNTTRLGGTILSAEYVNLFGNHNVVRQCKPAYLADIGFEVVKKIVKIGDVVILIPVNNSSEYSKKDSNGEILVLNMLVRRGFLERFKRSCF